MRQDSGAVTIFVQGRSRVEANPSRPRGAERSTLRARLWNGRDPDISNMSDPYNQPPDLDAPTRPAIRVRRRLLFPTDISTVRQRRT